MGYSTKQQHYIPQMVLKRFYADGYALDRESMGRKYLWMYDKEKKIERKVYDVKQICKEKNLYELKYNDKILDGTTNEIENFLSKLELEWSKIFNKIENNDSEKLNLSIDEIALIYYYFTIQMLRLPKMINAGTMFINTLIKNKLANNNIDPKMAEAFVKFSALYPYNMNDKKNKDFHWMQEITFLKFAQKDLTILHSNIPFLLNDEDSFVGKKLDNSQIDEILIPFSKNYALFLDGNSTKFNGIKNINKNCAHQINMEIAKKGKFLYSARAIDSLMSHDEINKICEYR